VTATADQASLAPPRETAEGWRGLEAFLVYLGRGGHRSSCLDQPQAGPRPSRSTSKTVALVSSSMPFVCPFCDL
jgi:hypothetical protein